MKTALLFAAGIIAVLLLTVSLAESPEQKFDGGYVQQPDPDCWKEVEGCVSRGMYPAGY